MLHYLNSCIEIAATTVVRDETAEAITSLNKHQVYQQAQHPLPLQVVTTDVRLPALS
ncbi:hypothetical protein KF707_17550 [Candidatus Obscuribacterales bacterium]|nr:hypothetical protein [Candidatus Obscuribacterales bacterium]